MRSLDSFGAVWSASGARGFFGEGYWFHSLVPGLNWAGSTFVAKTTTLDPRLGNMPLKADLSPRSLIPPCIVVKPFQGCVLNAVGLSGPGAEALFEDGRWQERTDPFFLSFMAVGVTKAGRLLEARDFAWQLRGALDWFKTDVALQVNVSCPNTGHAGDLAGEASEILRELRKALPVTALVAKLNVLFPIEAALGLEDLCDGICVSNSIPWGSTPIANGKAQMIPWNTMFQSSHSPLKHLGGGGLSGAPLLPLVADWVKRVREAGFKKHVNGCGGILKPADVNVMAEAGANSVSLGSIAMLRGWRLRRTIARARKLFA